MATSRIEMLRRLEEQRKARERMQSAMNVDVGGLSATPYIMDSFKKSGGWPGQAVDPLFVNNPNTVRVEAKRPIDDASSSQNIVPSEKENTAEMTVQESAATGRRPMEGLGLGLQNYATETKPQPESPPKEQVWGKYAQDPAARKKQYLDQLNKIYRNSMILNAIAQLTGGTSQANAYIKMATGKMDAIDKFDQEERLHNIWKNTFFSDGEFDKPLSYQQAYDRAIRLGATPKEAQEIAQTAYNKPSTTTGTSIGQTEQARYITVARESDNYTPEQIQDITNIVSKPNAVSVLQRKYPDLVDEYIKRKEQASISYNAALTATLGQLGTQSSGNGLVRVKE